jgi:Uma2 family endonuclease
VAVSGRLVTAEELLRMPDDGYRYELVRGELRKMTPAGFGHGVTVVNLTVPLGRHVRLHGLGVVCGAETGFILASAPDTVLAPDVAFVRRDRLPAGGLPTGFWRGAPDLAIEVLSPGDSAREAEDKARAWLEAGARVALMVDSRARTITEHRPGIPRRVLSDSETWDGAEVVPGFRFPVADAFAI